MVPHEHTLRPPAEVVLPISYRDVKKVSRILHFQILFPSDDFIAFCEKYCGQDRANSAKGTADASLSLPNILPISKDLRST